MSTDPATPAQMSYLRDLINKKEIPVDGSWDTAMKQAAIYLNPTESHPTRGQISELIDAFQKLPWLPRPKLEREDEIEATDEVPEGRYAIRVRLAPGGIRFIKIDRPTEGRWAGYLFVNEQSGDNRRPIRDKHERRMILSSIAIQGVEEAMRLYGQMLGHCAKCGRSLTDETSRAYGIGPECRKGMNLPKPEADTIIDGPITEEAEEIMDDTLAMVTLRENAEQAIAKLNAALGPNADPYVLYQP